MTQPVPNSISIDSSEIIGIDLFIIGTIAFFPIRFLYLVSPGLIQIALSPNKVSGLVVATVILSLLSSILYFI